MFEKLRLTVFTIIYLMIGFFCGMAIIDTDPVVKIFAVIMLMWLTMVYVYEMWRSLFK